MALAGKRRECKKQREPELIQTRRIFHRSLLGNFAIRATTVRAEACIPNLASALSIKKLRKCNVTKPAQMRGY
jgi:hypothetical protein